MNDFSKNSLITFSTEVLVFIFSFGTLIILSRVLGPIGKGIYSLILLIPGLMMTFGSFGIDTANVYFVGSKRYKIQDATSNSLILAILLGFILILIFWGIFQMSFFQNFISFNQIPPLYLWLVVLIIPMPLLSSFFRSILWAKGEIINCNKIRVIENAILFLAVMIFLLIFQQNIFGAVLSYILSIVGACLLSIFLVKKITKFRLFLNKNLLKDSVIYGGKVYLANSISFLSYRLDMLLIAMFLAPAAVGFYSIAVSMAERLFITSGVLAAVLFTKISSLSDSEATAFTPKIVRHTFFIMIITSLSLAVLATPLIKIIFGQAFLPSVLPLLILLPGIIAFGIGGVLAADLSGRGKPQFAIYSSFVCLIINIVLNILFIPKWGISGAAFASSVAYWADTLIIIWAFLKISKRSLKDVLVIKAQDFQDYLRLISNFREWLRVRKISIK
jgi:O-antigen/teichoic acid export membrane protein